MTAFKTIGTSCPDQLARALELSGKAAV